MSNTLRVRGWAGKERKCEDYWPVGLSLCVRDNAMDGNALSMHWISATWQIFISTGYTFAKMVTWGKQARLLIYCLSCSWKCEIRLKHYKRILSKSKSLGAYPRGWKQDCGWCLYLFPSILNITNKMKHCQHGNFQINYNCSCRTNMPATDLLALWSCSWQVCMYKICPRPRVCGPLAAFLRCMQILSQWEVSVKSSQPFVFVTFLLTYVSGVTY